MHLSNRAYVVGCSIGSKPFHGGACLALVRRGAWWSRQNHCGPAAGRSCPPSWFTATSI